MASIQSPVELRVVEGEIPKEYEHGAAGPQALASLLISTLLGGYERDAEITPQKIAGMISEGAFGLSVKYKPIDSEDTLNYPVYGSIAMGIGSIAVPGNTLTLVSTVPSKRQWRKLNFRRLASLEDEGNTYWLSGMRWRDSNTGNHRRSFKEPLNAETMGADQALLRVLGDIYNDAETVECSLGIDDPDDPDKDGGRYYEMAFRLPT
jgi:hypothetical protein